MQGSDVMVARERPTPPPVRPAMGVQRYARLSAYWGTVIWNLVGPNRTRSIFVLGPPRTGTNWFCRIMSHYFGLKRYVPREQVMPVLQPVVLHLHRFTIVPSRTVYLLRDPRDVAVSYYHKMVNTATPAVRTRALRHCPRPLEHENLRENLPGFLRFIYESDVMGSMPFDRHVRRAGKLGLYIIRYEDLLDRGDETLSGAIRHLTGSDPDAQRVRETLEATSFEKRTGRQRGEEDLTWAVVRKGIAGDWKNHFSTESARVFDECAGDLLIELGYERNADWLADVRDA